MVRADNTPIRPDDLAVDGVITVFPEARRRRLPQVCSSVSIPTVLSLAEGRDEWVVDGNIAYSKVCTHVGARSGCTRPAQGSCSAPATSAPSPCYEAGQAVFGPAATSLPQLPLDVDDDGYVIAADDLSGPLGPGVWDRDWSGRPPLTRAPPDTAEGT